MKRSLFILALFSVSACQERPAEPGTGNYLPETPRLSSPVMTPEVLWSFGRIGDGVVSPDGKTVAYSVTWYNVPEDKSYRDLYVLDLEGGESRRITDTAERESGLQWRPDGKKIGFLSPSSGTMQLWEINPDGSGKQQVSQSDSDIQGFRYSPDQQKIYLIKSVKLDQDIHDLFPDLPKANARLENDLMYRHWDSWHDYTYNHLFIADYDEGKLSGEKDILEGERFDSPTKPWGGIEEITWSPDGKTLAYTCKKLTGKAYSLSTNTDIYLYDTETGVTTNLTEGMPGYDKNPLFSPDGRMVAWESMERDGYEADKIRLFIADLVTGEKKDYSAAFDQNAEQMCWSGDGKSLFFISAREATAQIYRLNLEDGGIACLTEGVHNYGSPRVAGDKLLVNKVSMSYPDELFLVDPSTGSDKALTAVNKGILDQLTMGKVEKRMD